MKSLKVLLLPLTLLSLSLVLTNGCTTSQQTTTYKAAVGTDLTVSGAMTGWGLYVGANRPGTNAETQVLNAWKVVKAAELTLNDAETVLITTPTNTTPLLTAEAVYAAAQTNLFTTISSITNVINSK